MCTPMMDGHEEKTCPSITCAHNIPHVIHTLGQTQGYSVMYLWITLEQVELHAYGKDKTTRVVRTASTKRSHL
jgi:hypothetical protein